MERVTGYARLDSHRTAYGVVGDGPNDLVLSSGSFGAFDTDWEDDPAAELFFRRLASFVRLIRFGRRGTGASDPLPLDALPPSESFVEELSCVMDEVGSVRAAISTVTDLVVGSDLAFEDRGVRQLKGIQGEWPLLAVRQRRG